MNSIRRSSIQLLAVFLLGIGLTVGHSSLAVDAELTGEMKDAWLTGKVETVLALNDLLNQYAITARVTDGSVELNGQVKSEIDKSLATELMKGIADIDEVNNRIEIDNSIDVETLRTGNLPSSSFARWINDLTISAIIKSKLFSNSETGAVDIAVNTQDGVVMLRGEVGSPQERALAGEIAKNTRHVISVSNELQVRQQLTDVN